MFPAPPPTTFKDSIARQLIPSAGRDKTRVQNQRQAERSAANVYERESHDVPAYTDLFGGKWRGATDAERAFIQAAYIRAASVSVMAHFMPSRPYSFLQFVNSDAATTKRLCNFTTSTGMLSAPHAFHPDPLSPHSNGTHQAVSLSSSSTLWDRVSTPSPQSTSGLNQSILLSVENSMDPWSSPYCTTPFTPNSGTVGSLEDCKSCPPSFSFGGDEVGPCHSSRSDEPSRSIRSSSSLGVHDFGVGPAPVMGFNELTPAKIRRFNADIDMYITRGSLTEDDLAFASVFCLIVQATVRGFYLGISYEEWIKVGTLYATRTGVRPDNWTSLPLEMRMQMLQKAWRAPDIRDEPFSVEQAQAEASGHRATNDAASVSSHRSASSQSYTSRLHIGPDLVLAPGQAMEHASCGASDAVSLFGITDMLNDLASEAARGIEQSLERTRLLASYPSVTTPAYAEPRMYEHSKDAYAESPAVVESFLAGNKVLYKCGFHLHMDLPCTVEQWTQMQLAIVKNVEKFLIGNPLLTAKSAWLLHSKNPLAMQKDVTAFSRMMHWTETIIDPAPVSKGMCRCVFSAKSGQCLYCLCFPSISSSEPAAANGRKRKSAQSCGVCESGGACNYGPDSVATPFVEIDGNGFNACPNNMLDADVNVLRTTVNSYFYNRTMNCLPSDLFDMSTVKLKIGDQDVEAIKSQLEVRRPVAVMLRHVPANMTSAQVQKHVKHWVTNTSIHIPTSDVAILPYRRRHEAFWSPPNRCWCSFISGDQLVSGAAHCNVDIHGTADFYDTCSAHKHAAFKKLPKTSALLRKFEAVLTGKTSAKSGAPDDAFIGPTTKSSVQLKDAYLRHAISRVIHKFEIPKQRGVAYWSDMPALYNWPTFVNVPTALQCITTDMSGRLGDAEVASFFKNKATRPCIVIETSFPMRQCVIRETKLGVCGHRNSRVRFIVIGTHVFQLCPSSSEAKCYNKCYLLGTITEADATRLFDRAALDQVFNKR